MTFRPSLFFYIRLIIGIVLVVLLIWFVSPSAIIQSLQSANLFLILCAVGIYAGTFVFLTIRWRIIIAHLGESVPFIEAYQAFIGGVLYSDFTPGRIGDFSRAILIRRTISLHTGTASVFIDRYIDIIVLTGLGIMALILISSRFASVLPLFAVIILLILLTSVTIFFLQSHRFLALFRHIPCAGIPEFATQLQTAFSGLQDGKWVIAEGILLTIVSWITHALRVLLILMSLGYLVPFPDLFLILPLISALSLVPVSIAGLGLVEGGLMAVIAGYGIPVSVALSVAILDRGLTVLFHFVAGGRVAINNLVNAEK